MIEIGKYITAKSYKHKGFLHRTWNRCIFLDENEDYFVVGSSQTVITESNGSVWQTKDPAITLYSKKHWFNVVCMFKETGVYYYVNLASPTVFDESDQCLKFVDYDIDIRIDSNGKIRVVDIAEYHLNRFQLKYPKEVCDVLEATLFGLLELGKKGLFPFDPKMYYDYAEKAKKLSGEK